MTSAKGLWASLRAIAAAESEGHLSGRGSRCGSHDGAKPRRAAATLLIQSAGFLIITAYG